MTGFFYINMEFKSKYNDDYREYYKQYLRESIGELNKYVDDPQSIKIEEMFEEMKPVSHVAGEDIKVVLENLTKQKYTTSLGIDLSVMLKSYRHNIIQALEALSNLNNDETLLQLKYKKIVNQSNPSLNLRITTSSLKKKEVLNLDFPYELAKNNIEAVIIFSYLVGYLTKMIVHNAYRRK